MVGVSKLGELRFLGRREVANVRTVGYEAKVFNLKPMLDWNSSVILNIPQSMCLMCLNGKAYFVAKLVVWFSCVSINMCRRHISDAFANSKE